MTHHRHLGVRAVSVLTIRHQHLNNALQRKRLKGSVGAVVAAAKATIGQLVSFLVDAVVGSVLVDKIIDTVAADLAIDVLVHAEDGGAIQRAENCLNVFFRRFHCVLPMPLGLILLSGSAFNFAFVLFSKTLQSYYFFSTYANAS